MAFQPHQDEEQRDEQGHPPLNVLTGDEERRPRHHHEQGRGQVVRDHVVGHPTAQGHLKASHAVVA